MNLHRPLYVCVLIILCLLLAFVISVPYDEEDKCATETCKATGLDLLKTYMNIWADPCEDFYQFVCGTWARHHHPVREGLRKWGNFYLVDYLTKNKTIDTLLSAATASTDGQHQSHAVQYVTDFYRECAQTDELHRQGVVPLIDLLDSTLGGWPMLRSLSKAIDNDLEWPQLYSRVYSRTGLGVIFQFTTQQSVFQKLFGFTFGDSKRIEIQEGILGIDANDSVDYEDNLTKYRDYIRKSALLLGAPDDQQLTRDIEQMIKLEAKLAKLSSDGSAFDFETLNDDTHNRVDWLKLVNSILIENDSDLAHFDSTSSVIYDKDYLNALIKTLDYTPVKVVHNLFAWHIVKMFGLYTTDQFRANIAMFDPKENVDLRSLCLDTINDNWPWASGRVFVDAHFTPQDKKEAEQFVEEIKNSYVNIVHNTSWLDESTKERALNKLNSIKMNVGYPEWIKSDDALDSLYDYLDGVKVEKGKLMQTVAKQQALLKIKEFKEMNDDSGSNIALTWPLDILEVNAFYKYAQHSITIPAAIFQPPFYDKNRPLAMNFGSIGSIIGHEFTHAFDAYGHDLEFTWSNISSRNFNNRADCIEYEYSSIEDPVSGDNIDGRHTLDDNIADNGGMHESFGALQGLLIDDDKFGKPSVLSNVKLNSNQLFFVSYAMNWCSNVPYKEEEVAQEHSPDRYRVNVVLGNSAQFANAFQCPVGSNMNPKHKCTLW